MFEFRKANLSSEEVQVLSDQLVLPALSLLPGADVKRGDYYGGSKNYTVWADHPEKVARFLFTFFIDADNSTIEVTAFVNYVKKRSQDVRRRKNVYKDKFSTSDFDPSSIEYILSNAASEMRQIVESDSTIQLLNGLSFTDYGGAT